MSTGEYVSPAELSNFVAHVEAVTEKFPQMNEDNTKSKIIRNFLELLGWDFAFDAELEYSVPIGSKKSYVDYSLSVDSSSPVLFVEAKGYDTSLNDGHRNQLRSYLRQTDVDWGLLTNGKSFEIYRRENVENGVKIRTVADTDLSRLPERADYVGLLSKEALESGHSQVLAQRIFEIRQARDTLQTKKEDIARQITSTLTEVAGDIVSQEAETEAKVLVDRLVSELETQTEEIETEDSSKYNRQSFWKVVEDQVGIKKTPDAVELVESKTAADNYVDFVRLMFDQGYLSRSDLPIESGRIRYVLNTETKHKNGDDMTNPKEVINGVYLETHQNTEDKKRKIVELGEEFGAE